MKDDKMPWLIEFFTPNCPGCMQLKEEYVNLAKMLNGTVKVGAVNLEKKRE